MANMMQNLQNMQPQQAQIGTPAQRPQATWYGGRPEFTEQTPTLNQGQLQAQPQFLQQLLQMLQQGNQGQYEGFAPIEQQARSGFAQQTVPGLAERFTNMGSGASLSSPAFASQLGQAGAGLEQGIAGLKAQYGQNQQSLNNQRFGQLANLGFQPTFQNNHFARQPGLPENFLNALAPIVPFLPMLLGFGGFGGNKGGNNQPQQQQSQGQGFGQGDMLSKTYGVQPFQIPQSNVNYNFGGMQ